MRRAHRTVAAVASVLVMMLTMILAAGFAPGGPSIALVVMGVFAIAVSITAVVVNPRDLLAATVLALPPVMAAGQEPRSVWIVALLAALLLISAELNAFSWELEGPPAKPEAVRRRLGGVCGVSVLGLAASALVALAAQQSLLDGTAALAVASVALVGVGVLVFPRGGKPGSE